MFKSCLNKFIFFVSASTAGTLSFCNNSSLFVNILSSTILFIDFCDCGVVISRYRRFTYKKIDTILGFQMKKPYYCDCKINTTNIMNVFCNQRHHTLFLEKNYFDYASGVSFSNSKLWISYLRMFESYNLKRVLKRSFEVNANETLLKVKYNFLVFRN